MCAFSMIVSVRGGTENRTMFHLEWNIGVCLCQPNHRVLLGDLGQRPEPTCQCAYKVPDRVPVTNTGHACAGEQPATAGAAAQWVLNLPHSPLSLHGKNVNVFYCSFPKSNFSFSLFMLYSFVSDSCICNSIFVGCFFSSCLAALAAKDLDFERFHSVLQ